MHYLQFLPYNLSICLQFFIVLIIYPSTIIDFYQFILCICLSVYILLGFLVNIVGSVLNLRKPWTFIFWINIKILKASFTNNQIQDFFFFRNCDQYCYYYYYFYYYAAQFDPLGKFSCEVCEFSVETEAMLKLHR